MTIGGSCTPRVAAAALAVVVAGIAAAGCGGKGSTTATTHVAATTTSHPSTAPAPTTSTAGVGTVAVALPVVACQTTSPRLQETTTTQPAGTSEVDVPSSMKGQLSVYIDALGLLAVVAPTGFDCQAAVGEDGSGTLAAYPPTEQPAHDQNGFVEPQSLARAVTAIETSACSSCTLAQACPYFATAATTWQQEYGRPCPGSVPASEKVTPLGSTAVGIADPPGAKGGAVPSGGPDPANAVMTYVPGNPNGSFLGTCTLPSGQHAVCTASLNAFLARYGNE